MVLRFSSPHSFKSELPASVIARLLELDQDKIVVAAHDWLVVNQGFSNHGHPFRGAIVIIQFLPDVCSCIFLVRPSENSTMKTQIVNDKY